MIRAVVVVVAFFAACVYIGEGEEEDDEGLIAEDCGDVDEGAHDVGLGGACVANADCADADCHNAYVVPVCAEVDPVVCGGPADCAAWETCFDDVCTPTPCCLDRDCPNDVICVAGFCSDVKGTCDDADCV